MARARPNRPKRRRLLWLGVAVLAAGAVGFAVWDLSTLPDATAYATRNPQSTALIEQRAAEAKAKGYKARRRQQWVSLGAVAPHAVSAVIVSEDAGFWGHEGVDTVELRKAVEEAWEAGELGRGASTITQQLAKNLWLSTDRSLIRKAKEVILAKRLEDALTKKRILTLYLNVVEWGEGVYGIEAGAREHFGVSASEVTPAQAAILAAMLPAPRRWLPANKPAILKKRALRIVDRLAITGKLTAEQAAAARDDVARILG